MIRVRDDDILVHSSSGHNPVERFKKVHDIIVAGGALHVPAILTLQIQKFEPAIQFIKEETDIGRMEPQWHGWDHLDYKDIKYDQICWDIAKSQILFVKWFGVRFTKFYTPWGANADHIKKACEDHGIEMVDCTDLIRPVHVKREPEKFRGKEVEIMVHWWEGINRLKDALALLR
jgi:hypothetical protein